MKRAAGCKSSCNSFVPVCPLLWTLVCRKELQQFSRLTRRVPPNGGEEKTPLRRPGVVMGRKTWDSIPEKFRPLPGRVNYVMTRSRDAVFNGAVACGSFEEVVQRYAADDAATDTLWAIGGHSVYQLALNSPLLHRVYVTRVHEVLTCDTFLPPLPDGLKPTTDPDVSQEEQIEGDVKYHYEVLEKQACE